MQTLISAGIYDQARARSWAAHALAECADGSPLTERLLQLVWQYQRLRADLLETVDGQPLRILHPGFWNHEPGPDFRRAVIQVGDTPARNGDVEVDLTPQGWRAHRHDQNPAFKHVILHVVWEADSPSPADLPTLALKPRLDAPLDELALWLRKEPQSLPASVLGQCSTSLRNLPPEQLKELLRQAARVRLQSKGCQLQARARQVGWEQALWEGLFGALGYKNNVWPMRRISEWLPSFAQDWVQSKPASTVALQARLLGVSGLLPGELEQLPPSSQVYVRTIWNLWWRERERFADATLPRSVWRLNPIRPANHPQRRLALAAHWLATNDLPARLEQWFAETGTDSNLPQSLLEVLQAGGDEFWSCHWTLESLRMLEPQPLLGPQRVTDIAINVILPWFWIRALVGKNSSLQTLAEECYFAWPKAEDNAILRLARRRLFGSTKVEAISSAAMQQAVLQIVRDFCDYSNALCQNCPFATLTERGVA